MLRKLTNRAARFLPMLIVIICLWYGASFAIGLKQVPYPHSVIWELVKSFESNQLIAHQEGKGATMLPHFLESLRATFFGLIIGTVAGVGISVIGYHSKLVGNLLEPVSSILRAIPPLVMVPFILILTKTSVFGTIAVVSFYAGSTATLYAYSAVTSIPEAYANHIKILGGSKWFLSKTLIIPGSFARAMAGIRLSIPLTIGVLGVAEYIGPSQGIGKVMKYAVGAGDISLLFVGLVLSVLLVLFLDALVGTLIPQKLQTSRYFNQ